MIPETKSQLIDCCTFFDEVDVLEIRLHELDPIADHFVICEAGEDYSGHEKNFNLMLHWERFKPFHKKITYAKIVQLEPKCKDLISGRLREAFQRDVIGPYVASLVKSPDDLVTFSDCDEIPSAKAIVDNYSEIMKRPHRLKQYTFYYNVNVLTDYGHDWASRARVAKFVDFEKIPSCYEFRGLGKNDQGFPAIEEGGWHFSYFGGVQKIHRKVAALRPFLAEYKLYGEKQLIQDILDRKDLHHRRCEELPKIFDRVKLGKIVLPKYLTENIEKFHHFTEDYFLQKYRGEKCSEQSASA